MLRIYPNTKATNKKSSSIYNCNNTDTKIKILSKIKINKRLAKFKKSDFTKASFSELSFLTFEVKTVFIYLKKTFPKLQILYDFDLKYNIKIEIYIFGYVID